MTKKQFLDYLFFDRRQRVTFTTNANKQKIYTAKNDRERLTFGKCKRGAPLFIKRITYTDAGTVANVKYFKSYRDFIKAADH